MRTFHHLRVFVQTLERTIEKRSLELLCLSQEPTLDDLRKLLQMSPLGEAEVDIFFPDWTASLHVVLMDPLKEQAYTPSWDEIEERKITVVSSEHLRKILLVEEEAAGTVSIVLQVCRSKRYSRKANFMPPSVSLITSPLTSDVGTPPRTPTPTENSRIGDGVRSHQVDPPPMAPLPTPPEFCQPGHSYDNNFVYEHFVPLGAIAPATIYHPFYAVPVGVGYYGLVHGPPVFAPVVPGYYAYPAV